MYQVAYLDPADLVIRLDFTFFVKKLKAYQCESNTQEMLPLLLQLVRHAFPTESGISDKARKALEAAGPPALTTLLALWHEQRHFLDHFLTNYGASRFRLHYQLRAQLHNILKVAKQEGAIGLPLHVYADEVTCERLGLSPASRNILAGIGQYLIDRRNMCDSDRKTGASMVPKEALPLDGFAQLEGSRVYGATASNDVFGSEGNPPVVEVIYLSLYQVSISRGCWVLSGETWFSRGTSHKIR